MTHPFQTLLTRLPDTPLFKGLDAMACHRLGELTTMRSYAAGEVVITEGATDPYLYIIRHGSVRIEKATSDGEGTHTLNALGAGETVGEMKLVTYRPASATVIAAEPAELMCVDLLRLRTEPDESDLQAALLRNIAYILSERLRGSSTVAADAMEAEIQQGHLRESAGRFIVYLFAVMSAFAFLVAGLNALGSRRPPQTLLSACLILSASAPVAWLLRQSPYPPTVYGITLHRWRRVTWESVIYTLPILGLVTLVKVGLIFLDPRFHHLPLIQPVAVLGGPVTFASWIVGVVAYSVLAIPQEFFVRSGLQGSMELFVGRPDGKINWRVIVIANLIFASAHTYLGLRYMLAAFIPGLFWGWLFARQRSLVGVAVSHALVGIWALFVVGLQVLVGGN